MLAGTCCLTWEELKPFLEFKHQFEHFLLVSLKITRRTHYDWDRNECLLFRSAGPFAVTFWRADVPMVTVAASATKLWQILLLCHRPHQLCLLHKAKQYRGRGFSSRVCDPLSERNWLTNQMFPQVVEFSLFVYCFVKFCDVLRHIEIWMNLTNMVCMFAIQSPSLWYGFPLLFLYYFSVDGRHVCGRRWQACKRQLGEWVFCFDFCWKPAEKIDKLNGKCLFCGTCVTINDCWPIKTVTFSCS